MATFNRTIEELKYYYCHSMNPVGKAFNRTIEELKSETHEGHYLQNQSFNRTIEELKYAKLANMAANTVNF